MLITPAFRRHVTGEADDSKIREHVYKEGTKPLRMSGAMNVATGYTSAGELSVAPPN